MMRPNQSSAVFIKCKLHSTCDNHATALVTKSAIAGCLVPQPLMLLLIVDPTMLVSTAAPYVSWLRCVRLAQALAVDADRRISTTVDDNSIFTEVSHCITTASPLSAPPLVLR